eukprot:gene50079-biopygen35193
MKYNTLDEAIAIQNAVGAGLSSSIFTLDMREAETFISGEGSDCGIANVNIGPSGAEIGGAFGGEKETGGEQAQQPGLAGLDRRMPVDGDAAAGGETGRQEAHHSLGDQTLAAASLADQEQDGAGLKRQVDIADQSGADPGPERHRS